MMLQKAAAELARGVGLARAGGLPAGLRFVGEELLRNSWLRARAAFPGPSSAGVECNLCGWRGRRFLTHCAVDYVDRNAFCPRCRSYPRHRAFAWLWHGQLAGSLAYLKGGSGKKLMFAPEPGMLSLLEPDLGPLEGADPHSTSALVKHREDLQELSFADGSVDFISCFHVLEHVPDDRRALGELHRVLSPQGRLILCVPIAFGRAETRDLGGPQPSLNGHCFDYGEDFPDRLTEAGFAGHSYRPDELVPSELHRTLALKPEEIFLLRRSAGEARIERHGRP